MKYARIVDTEAVDVMDIDPSGMFVAGLVFVEVPDAVVSGSRLVVDENGDEQWLAPSVAAPAPVIPPVIVPAVVTMRQARLAMLNRGLLSGVAAAIDALPEPDKSKAAIEWEYASEVERTSPLIVVLCAELGLPDADVDALFIEAGGL